MNSTPPQCPIEPHPKLEWRTDRQQGAVCSEILPMPRNSGGRPRGKTVQLPSTAQTLEAEGKGRRSPEQDRGEKNPSFGARKESGGQGSSDGSKAFAGIWGRIEEAKWEKESGEKRRGNGWKRAIGVRAQTSFKTGFSSRLHIYREKTVNGLVVSLSITVLGWCTKDKYFSQFDIELMIETYMQDFPKTP